MSDVKEVPSDTVADMATIPSIFHSDRKEPVPLKKMFKTPKRTKKNELRSNAYFNHGKKSRPEVVKVEGEFEMNPSEPGRMLIYVKYKKPREKEETTEGYSTSNSTSNLNLRGT